MTHKEKLIELINDCNCIEGYGQDLVEQQVDYLLDNGVIVLPCKVGDKIYEICEQRKNSKRKQVIKERVVYGLEAGIHGNIMARCGTTVSVFMSGLGETVFLTREEAEKALEERDGNG